MERLIKYSNDYQANLLSNQHSLFGGTSEANIAEPGLPDCDPWPLLEKLRLEKEVIGMYLSGHPLDDFRLELKSRSEEHTSELQSLMRISYAVFCLKNKKSKIL